MSYNPQSDSLDFEIGAFGDKLVKGFKAFTDATIVKPTAFVGGLVGGKKGRKLGEKLGKGLAFGVSGGHLGQAAMKAVSGKKKPSVSAGKSSGASRFGKIAAKVKAGYKPPSTVKHAKPAPKGDCALAAKTAAQIVDKLGGPLNVANAALKLAALQRTATYEHKKLMTDAEFRRKVLSGIAGLAANGDVKSQRTIRVLVNR